MPEAPEVETVCRGLRPHIVGQRIASIQLNRPDLRFPFPQHFVVKGQGARVHSITRRSKYILMSLENHHTLLVHLGMSGQMLVRPQDESKHDHVRFILDSDTSIVYRDPRRFGFMDLFEQPPHYLTKLGPEANSGDFSADYLHHALGKRKGPIKNILLNQEMVAGLGNIYACEALFKAGIHPERPGHQINKTECTALVEAIKTVLERAIESGGSSLRDHLQVDGTLGYFQYHFSVYGKSGQPCEVCTQPTFSMKQSGRTTFFCETCQR